MLPRYPHPATQATWPAVPPRRTHRCICSRITQALVAASLLVLGASAHAAVCRVATDGVAANSGSSWGQASTLRAALDNTGGKDCTEIWVKAGTYDDGAELSLSRDLVLLGGFAGTEASAAARPSPLNAAATVLDGGGTHRVLLLNGTTGTPITSATRIEGFTITRGAAVISGGGMFCDGRGAGSACSPALSHLVFSNNTAASSGGALLNDGNTSGASSPTLTHVTFSGNSAVTGGAVFNAGYDAGTSNPSLTNVSFSGNSASDDGGAMFTYADTGGTSSPTLVHTTFSGNTATDQGGAIVNFAAGTGISATVLRNSILWGNTPAAIANTGTATVTVHTSLVEGGCAVVPGTTCTGTNLGTHPQLGALADNGGGLPTLLPSATSPALDVADTAFCPATDQRGITRPQGAGCDMGAVEVQVVAAMPVQPVPALDLAALTALALLLGTLGAARLQRS